MRKIEQEMVQAIRARKNWIKGNTEVCIPKGNAAEDLGIINVYLHGNRIARFYPEEGWKFSLAGWPTPTTRSRVNAMLKELRPGMHIVQNFGKQLLLERDQWRYISDTEWF